MREMKRWRGASLRGGSTCDGQWLVLGSERASVATAVAEKQQCCVSAAPSGEQREGRAAYRRSERAEGSGVSGTCEPRDGSQVAKNDGKNRRGGEKDWQRNSSRSPLTTRRGANFYTCFE